MSAFGAGSIPKDLLVKIIAYLRYELDISDTAIPSTKGDLDVLAMDLKRRLPKSLDYTWTYLANRVQKS